jgi:predicted transcriptional regulator
MSPRSSTVFRMTTERHVRQLPVLEGGKLVGIIQGVAIDNLERCIAVMSYGPSTQ